MFFALRHPLLRTALAATVALASVAATAQMSEPVKVGLLSTLSGPGAGLGVDIRDGFELAVKLNNGKLGGRLLGERFSTSGTLNWPSPASP